MEGLNNPRALMWVLGALVLMLVGGSVVIWLELGVAGYLGPVTVASPWLVPLLVLQPWRIIRAQPAIWSVYDELRDSDPDAPVYQLGALAAWPRGQRHGSALLTALLEVAPVDGFVVGLPAQQRAARLVRAARDDRARGWRAVPGSAQESRSYSSSPESCRSGTPDSEWWTQPRPLPGWGARLTQGRPPSSWVPGVEPAVDSTGGHDQEFVVVDGMGDGECGHRDVTGS